MYTPSGRAPLDPESLSALCDGELDDAHTERWLQAWAEDESMHERWHQYHLIGDALRSSDLGGDLAHDNAFLLAVRQRLSEVVADSPDDQVAPMGTRPVGRVPSAEAATAIAPVRSLDDARQRRRLHMRRWSVPAGIAAGVALVAGLFTLVHRPASEEGLAAADGADREVKLVDRNGRRDPRLDTYLAAHRQFQPATALGQSSGFLRSAAYEVGPDR
ncbi:MAG: hypothetical protein RIQ60_2847 [Pseudomonadota bacterium]|jgi:sigma-E factor negative regulatory protein RseA